MPLQIRRGTDAERTAMSTPLAEGELLYVTDDQRLYIGNGTTLGGVSITGYTNEDAQDTVNTMFQAGSHSGISFTYDDAGNAISAAVDLTAYTGEISGSIQGSVFAENSTLLVDADTASIKLDGTVKGHIVPDQDSVYDLGSVTEKFRDLYLSGSSLYLGSAQITSTGLSVNLPAGSTVGGSPILGGDGGLTGDLQGSVFGDDSTVIVDGTDNSINTSLIKATAGNILSIGTDVDPTQLIVNTDQPILAEFNGVTDGVANLPYLDVNASRGTLSSPAVTTDPFTFLSGVRLQGYDGVGNRPTAALFTARTSEFPNVASTNPASDIVLQAANNNDPFSIFVGRSNGIWGATAFQFATFVNGVDPLQSDKLPPSPSPDNVLIGTAIFNGNTDTIEMYLNDSDGAGAPGYVTIQGRDPIAKTYTDATRPIQASFTASIADDSTEPTLTVTSVAQGYLRTGMLITGSGVAAGTSILEQRDGTLGGVGNYRLNISQTVGSTAMTGPAVTAGTMIFNSTSGEFQGWDGSTWVTLG